MEKKTKIILLSVLSVGVVAYLTRDKWMPKKYPKPAPPLSDDKKYNLWGWNPKKKKITSDNPTNVVLGGTPVCVTTCEYTNKSNGSVSVWAGGCNPTKANQGWTTITRCSGGGSNTIMNAE